MKKYLYLIITASLLAFATSTVLAQETLNSSETVQTELTEPTTTGTATNTETPAPQPAEEEHQDISIEDYEKNIAGLQEVDIQTVYGLFTEESKGENTLYLGRPTCVHCRLFSPTLKEFNNLIDGKLAYYNIDSEDFDQTARDFLFKTVGIPGTQTILHLVDGKLQAGWVGGGVTAEELYKNLYKKDYIPKTNETEVPGTVTIPSPEVNESKKTKAVEILSTVNHSTPNQESNLQARTDGQQPIKKAVTSFIPSQVKTGTSNSDKTLPKTGDKARLRATFLGLVGLGTAGVLLQKKY